MVRNRQGMAIYLVAILAMILFSLGALLSFRSTFSLAQQRRVRHSLEARYLAEAGVQRALHRMRHGKDRFAETFDYGGGLVTTRFEPGTGPFGEPVLDILSRGQFQDLPVVLFAKAEINPEFIRAGGADPVPDLLAATSPKPASPPAGLRVATVKYVLSLADPPGKKLDLMEANRQFAKRIKAANERYVNDLAGLSRAELRWAMYQLGLQQAGRKPGP